LISPDDERGVLMAVECINPGELETPLTYSHAVVATGTRMVFVAGQVAEDRAGNIVGPGDMEAQARQVFANIGHTLAAAGARPDQVTKLTIFVADYRREHLALIERGRVALFGDHKPTDTLVGVAALSRPEYLLEVDAVAVVDDVA
jgi:enamine deaminase RidA (YjgF/YER057c/UK114 family)